MGIFSGLFRSRDKPKDSYDSPSYSYFFGRTHAGKRVNDRTAMQIIAVYACVRVLSEAIAQLPSPDVAEGTVMNEVKRGWLLHGKLLRAAQVVVSAGKKA